MVAGETCSWRWRRSEWGVALQSCSSAQLRARTQFVGDFAARECAVTVRSRGI